MRSASFGTPAECDGIALVQSATTPRSAAMAPPRVPIRNNSAVARSAPAASSTRSLKAPANPCSAQKITIAARPDRRRDRRRVMIHRHKLSSGLLDARGGDAAHRIHHRAELADAFDAGANIREALGHDAPLSPDALDDGVPAAGVIDPAYCFSVPSKIFERASSIVPVAWSNATASAAPRSSEALKPFRNVTTSGNDSG